MKASEANLSIFDACNQVARHMINHSPRASDEGKSCVRQKRVSVIGIDGQPAIALAVRHNIEHCFCLNEISRTSRTKVSTRRSRSLSVSPIRRVYLSKVLLSRLKACSLHVGGGGDSTLLFALIFHDWLAVD